MAVCACGVCACGLKAASASALGFASSPELEQSLLELRDLDEEVEDDDDDDDDDANYDDDDVEEVGSTSSVPSDCCDTALTPLLPPPLLLERLAPDCYQHSLHRCAQLQCYQSLPAAKELSQSVLRRAHESVRGRRN